MAQPAKPPGAKRTSPEDEARARFNEGVALADASDHEAARLKFNQAWALHKSPVILYNLARSEQLSGHHVEALEHYRQFRRISGDPKITEQMRQRANENEAELSRMVGQIEIEAPAGSKITIDGRPVESPEELVPVSPGQHVVEATIDGSGRTVTIDCPAGVVTKASLLPPRPTEPAPAAAVTVVPPREPEPSSFWSAGRIVGLSIAGVGLVGAGLGVMFHLGATSAADRADEIRGTFDPERKDSACSTSPPAAGCDELREKVDEQASQETLRTAFFIGGGVLLLGGVVTFIASGPRRTERTASTAPAKPDGLRLARILPTAGSRQVGLSLGGTF